jgi:hypothetical protein
MVTSLLSFFACVQKVRWARKVASLLTAVETSLRSVGGSLMHVEGEEEEDDSGYLRTRSRRVW